MDLSKFKNTDGVYYNDVMVESWDDTKLNLVRQFKNDKPKAIFIILHGLANNLTLYDDFVKPFIEANIGVYRYDARGHGKSEGKRGYVNSFWEMVDDLKVIVNLAKQENPGVKVFVLSHSMGGHVAALPKDAIEFYEQTVAKDKSLFIYAGVNHFLMNDIKGHMITGDVLNWIEDRLGNTLYEEFEF